MSSDDARNDGPTWDRVMSDLKAVVNRDHPDCAYAALVVHIRDGVPDLRIPIIPCRPSDADRGPS